MHEYGCSFILIENRVDLLENDGVNEFKYMDVSFIKVVYFKYYTVEFMIRNLFKLIDSAFKFPILF